MTDEKILICVDSDGCVMDVMDIKHIRCFGPCLVKVYGLEEFEEAVLQRWNTINLYSAERGINRFQALCRILTEIDKKYKRVDGVETLRDWTENTEALSEAALEAAIREMRARGLSAEPLQRAMEWSVLVNTQIRCLPEGELAPYPSAARVLRRLGAQYDIAVVSSANPAALKAEWERHKLAECVRYFMSQDCGTKEECIRRLLREGYRRETVLMVGDAPGDLRAAEANGVYFYPIVPGKENASWDRLEENIRRLASGLFGKKEQEALLKEFTELLK
ncbi:HAD family hydrolase [Lachnoclostridium sp. Marseille-P6806]|uniref:HAD family hydrolase n=1 Tax=Lachnoclostridium sp. Marseille-P6806 TaxID=2364793 RepID=UPI00103194F7|nr:HAD family hydrolase [Lachnoclostridium sp. Marseille-P6806]